MTMTGYVDQQVCRNIDKHIQSIEMNVEHPQERIISQNTTKLQGAPLPHKGRVKLTIPLQFRIIWCVCSRIVVTIWSLTVHIFVNRSPFLILRYPSNIMGQFCSSNICSSNRTFLEHMFTTNMPKCDTIACKHDGHGEHTSNIVSNTSNICSFEHMFLNMPNHAFWTWARGDSGRRSWLRVGRHTHTHTYSTPAQAKQTQTTNLQRLATKAALNPMHSPLWPNGSNLRPWNCITATNRCWTQLEHGANMPRTWNGSCAHIVGTS